MIFLNQISLNLKFLWISCKLKDLFVQTTFSFVYSITVKHLNLISFQVVYFFDWIILIKREKKKKEGLRKWIPVKWLCPHMANVPFLSDFELLLSSAGISIKRHMHIQSDYCLQKLDPYMYSPMHFQQRNKRILSFSQLQRNRFVIGKMVLSAWNSRFCCELWFLLPTFFFSRFKFGSTSNIASNNRRSVCLCKKESAMNVNNLLIYASRTHSLQFFYFVCSGKMKRRKSDRMKLKMYCIVFIGWFWLFWLNSLIAFSLDLFLSLSHSSSIALSSDDKYNVFWV